MLDTLIKLYPECTRESGCIIAHRYQNGLHAKDRRGKRRSATEHSRSYGVGARGVCASG